MMEPQIDSWVVTADGRPIGRIKRVDDAAFLLDVPGGLDYWLSRDDIGEVGEAVVRTVRMSFDAAELEDHLIKYGE